MKTPDEIKKGLDICSNSASCRGCPYLVYVEGSFGCVEMGCEDDLLPDALAYIQQIEAERDALFKEVRGRCSTCKHFDKEVEEEPCASCVVVDGDSHKWEWRGAQKEE